jgi:hypothetical protein
LIESLFKYGSWYWVFLAQYPEIMLKRVELSKGPSESRWSVLISKGTKVIKLSFDIALRNLSQCEEEGDDSLSSSASSTGIDRLIEYGERPSLQQRSETRRIRNRDSDENFFSFLLSSNFKTEE